LKFGFWCHGSQAARIERNTTVWDHSSCAASNDHALIMYYTEAAAYFFHSDILPYMLSLIKYDECLPSKLLPCKDLWSCSDCSLMILPIRGTLSESKPEALVFHCMWWGFTNLLLFLLPFTIILAIHTLGDRLGFRGEIQWKYMFSSCFRSK
jgi:hypothetical protein